MVIKLVGLLFFIACTSHPLIATYFASIEKILTKERENKSLTTLQKKQSSIQ